MLTIAVSLSFLMAGYQPMSSLITGLAVYDTVNVSVKPVTSLFLRVDLSSTSLNIGDVENISVIAQNIGSVSATSQINLTVYTFNGTDLVTKALYQDSSVLFYPGKERVYATSFVPTENAFYYVRARMAMGTTVFEAWNSFAVLATQSNSTSPPPSSGGSGGGSSGGGGGGTVTVNVTRVVNPLVGMNLTYPSSVRMGQGDSTLFAIGVNNTGSVPLSNIKIFISAPTFIDFDVNPKIIQAVNPYGANYQGPYESQFLVSLRTSPNVTLGDYPFEFKVISNEASESGQTTISVLPPGALGSDDIRQRILSYGIIILDTEQQIASARLNGVDVTQANESLNQARVDLEKVKQLFDQHEYDKARLGLDDVKSSLERASLQLATASFFVYRPPSIPFVQIAAILAAAAAGALAYYYWKRRNRRPRMLRGLEQEKEE